MNNELTRRDFMKAAGLGVLLTSYAAKTAGAKDREDKDERGALRSASETLETASSKSVDPEYYELALQVRSNAILDGRINPNSKAPYSPK